MTAVRLARGFTGRAAHHQVRRLLPRPRRLAAGAGRVGRRDPRAAGFGGRDRGARRPRRSSCPTTTSPPSRRRSRSAATGSPRSSPRRRPANMGVVPPLPGLQRGPPRGSRRRTARCSSWTRCSPGSASARPAGGGWRARSRAGHPRPVHVRQGHRRRDAGSGARRRAAIMDHLAPHGPVYQAGTLSGNPVAIGRRARDPAAADAAVYARLTRSPPRCRPTRRRGADRRRASSTACSAPGSLFSCSSGRRAAAPGCATTRGPRRRRPSGTRRSSTRCSTPGSTCRRRSSRPGSSPPRTTTPP